MIDQGRRDLGPVACSRVESQREKNLFQATNWTPGQFRAPNVASG